MRTDLDRFSSLEISSLIRHGYCVGRKACREHPDLFGVNLPADPPWDPVPTSRGAAPASANVPRVEGRSRQPTPATVDARTLQASTLRRIWSTLLDWRDWTSYVYVPILVPILIMLPYIAVKAYQRSHRQSQLVESLSQGSHDLDEMTRLLESPSTPYAGVPFEEIEKPGRPDPENLEILQDSRIVDLRGWKPGEAGTRDPNSFAYGYRRVKLAKNPDYSGENVFNLYLLPRDPLRTVTRFPAQQLQPKLLRSMIDVPGSDRKEACWQASYDLHSIPAGDVVDAIVEYYSPGSYIRRSEGSSAIPIHVYTPTAELTLWVLLPSGKEYQSWQVVRSPQDKPNSVERVKVVTNYLSEDHTILAFKLLSLKPEYNYEVQWFYK
jgi:hypothetical protein